MPVVTSVKIEVSLAVLSISNQYQIKVRVRWEFIQVRCTKITAIAEASWVQYFRSSALLWPLEKTSLQLRAFVLCEDSEGHTALPNRFAFLKNKLASSFSVSLSHQWTRYLRRLLAWSTRRFRDAVENGSKFKPILWKRERSIAILETRVHGGPTTISSACDVQFIHLCSNYDRSLSFVLSAIRFIHPIPCRMFKS
jgi:hypothetical protein